MRALLGIDPDSRADGHDPAEEWEAALGYYGRDLVVQSLRGPGTPWARMRRGHERLTRAGRPRSWPPAGAATRRPRERGGIVSMLMEARDEDGEPLSDEAVRDHVLTLLFAGHDTTTATITFMLYELARNPHELVLLRDELDSVLADGPRCRPPRTWPRSLPRLDMAVDETLRLYPPAWIGPRRSVDPFEFDGKPRARRRARELLLVGQPPDPRGVPRPRTRSCPTASRRRRRPSCRRAPTSRSAAARAPASACASG